MRISCFVAYGNRLAVVVMSFFLSDTYRISSRTADLKAGASGDGSVLLADWEGCSYRVVDV